MMTPEQYKSIEERAVKYLEDNGVRVSRITTYEHGAEFGFHLRDEEVERLRYALQNAILTRDNHWAELDTIKKQVESMRDLLNRALPYLMHDWGYDPSPERLKDEIRAELKSATYITDKQ